MNKSGGVGLNWPGRRPTADPECGASAMDRSPEQNRVRDTSVCEACPRRSAGPMEWSEDAVRKEGFFRGARADYLRLARSFIARYNVGDLVDEEDVAAEAQRATLEARINTGEFPFEPHVGVEEAIEIARLRYIFSADVHAATGRVARRNGYRARSRAKRTGGSLQAEAGSEEGARNGRESRRPVPLDERAMAARVAEPIAHDPVAAAILSEALSEALGGLSDAVPRMEHRVAVLAEACEQAGVKLSDEVCVLARCESSLVENLMNRKNAGEVTGSTWRQWKLRGLKQWTAFLDARRAAVVMMAMVSTLACVVVGLRGEAKDETRQPSRDAASAVRGGVASELGRLTRGLTDDAHQGVGLVSPVVLGKGDGIQGGGRQ